MDFLILNLLLTKSGGKMDSVLNNLILELNRGTQVLMVLKLLNKYEYGYSLLQKLNDQNIDIEAGTLYPLLRRLESQNLLDSKWDEAKIRPRKYYIISEYGQQVLKELIKEWQKITQNINKILELEK